MKAARKHKPRREVFHTKTDPAWRHDPLPPTPPEVDALWEQLMALPRGRTPALRALRFDLSRRLNALVAAAPTPEGTNT